jgi:hypothetical protein
MSGIMSRARSRATWTAAISRKPGGFHGRQRLPDDKNFMSAKWARRAFPLRAEPRIVRAERTIPFSARGIRR